MLFRSPPKLPPLELTSTPVDVPALLPQGRLAGLFMPLSLALHVAVIGGLIGSQIYDMFQQADAPLTQAMLAQSAVMLAPPPPPPPPPPPAAGIKLAPVAAVRPVPVSPEAVILPKELSPKVDEKAVILPDAPILGGADLQAGNAGAEGGVQIGRAHV